MAELSWAATVRLVHERANYCCEYCQTSQEIIGQAMHVEHIDPTGSDEPDNLCLSCATCNLSKAKAVTGFDPDTGETVELFNPRLQQWSEHFVWIEHGLRLKGLTPVGRATIERLKINLERVVNARHYWIKAGGHPPDLKESDKT
ncbi:MAG: HNH endonuclease [Chloroflexota bacterium]|nr:HNH endonuclease [Chloroflexota bacterium]NOG65490.1 HNH endonuclease [Chloroflexota bacterium]GIK64405.1 MAG: HNH endonuclease [Chloroflexota bacterium]